MNPSTKALIVFVKAPEPKKVKTRLGESIGYKKAAYVYEQLLNYTAQVCEKLDDTDVYIFHDEKISQNIIWEKFNNQLQIKGDLGQKMEHAFGYCFEKGYKKVACIGSDCITIQPKDLENAFFDLENKELVFGPATDGGYYLIGMRNLYPIVFQNMPWSQSNLLLSTLEICKSKGLSVTILRTLSDIDYEDDLLSHKEELKMFNKEFFSFLDDEQEFKLSVIIPAYNEEKTILKCIELLDTTDNRLKEIIVVDGQSSDQTVSLAKKTAAKVIVSPQKGRAFQMNYGASQSIGNYLYFVHADTQVPASYLDDIQSQKEAKIKVGCYRFKFDTNHTLLKLNAFMTRFPFLICRGGDQTLFIEKKLFDQLDGFDEKHTIMEDYSILQKVKKRKENFRVIPKNVIVSSRKYDENSYWKVQYANYIAYNMFKKGKSQEEIKKKYKQLIKLERYE